MVIHKEKSYYVLVGLNFNLYAFTLAELILQAKEVYNINLLTLLN